MVWKILIIESGCKTMTIEEHARHDFIRQYHGKRLIVEIIRQHDNEKIY